MKYLFALFTKMATTQSSANIRSMNGVSGVTGDVEVTGRASGNTATDIVIPATVVYSGTTYSVTTIGDIAFYNNVLTSVAFEVNFFTFSLDMFRNNPSLVTITYYNGTSGWPQGFNNGSTVVVTTPIVCLPLSC